MLHKLTYTTIKSTNTYTLGPIKGSNFIGIAFPCTGEKQRKQQLQTTHKDHARATHHCRAYRLPPGTRTDIFGTTRLHIQKEQCSDDGEPPNTAGRPILKVLQGKDIYAVHVIIIRYYGGTKLGIGGLIQAYTRTTQKLLAQSSYITKELTQKICIQCSYANTGKIMHILQRYEATIHNHICKKQAHIKAYINIGLTSMIVQECENMSDVAVKLL